MKQHSWIIAFDLIIVCTLSFAQEAKPKVKPTETPQASAKETSKTIPQNNDPLFSLNQEFRAIYQQAREKLLQESGPIILVSGNELILLHGKLRDERKVTPEIYHSLKTIAHVPLGIFACLAPYPEDDLIPLQKLNLKRFRQLIESVQKSLNEFGFNEKQLKRQRLILTRCLAFIDQTLEQETYHRKALRTFAQEIAPLTLENAQEASQAKIDAMHSEMLDWKKQLSKEEWQQLKVVIRGSPMARKGNLATQYFAYLLNEQGEGTRIIYAESLWEESEALKLYATHQMDSKSAEAFFGDRWRLHQDLLSEATSKYLQQLTSEKSKPQDTPKP